MAKINGTNVRLFVDGEQIAHEGTLTLDVSRDMSASTDKDSGGWAEHLADGGLRNWSGSGEANTNYTPTGTDVNIVDLTDLILDRQEVDLLFDVATGASISGFVTLGGKASLANVSLSAGNEETSTISFEFTGNGALVKGS